MAIYNCRSNNPLNHITSDYPPTFDFTATGHYLRDQTPLLAAKLQAMDVPFVYRFYGDKDNRLDHVFHCNMRSVDGRQCNDEQCAFFTVYARQPLPSPSGGSSARKTVQWTCLLL